MKKIVVAVFGLLVMLALLFLVPDLPDPDPFQLGEAALAAHDLELAKRYMEKVPPSHAKYKDATAMLDEQYGVIGTPLKLQAKLEMEASRAREDDKIKKDEIKKQLVIAQRLEQITMDAQISCKTAAVSAAKWDGAESDWTNKSDVYTVSDDALRVVGRDVKWANGFGAKGYIEYTGIYSLSKKSCAIVSAGL